MTRPDAATIIERMGLQRHPEGGWYCESYRSAETVPGSALPERFSGDRALGTAIYFLLGKNDISALHRIASDEIWHFYAGTTLTLHLFTKDGKYLLLNMGSDIASGETFQAVIPAGCWFGAEVSGSGEYSLVGCTVAPGFDFADFELATSEQILKQFPEHKELIIRLT